MNQAIAVFAWSAVVGLTCSMGQQAIACDQVVPTSVPAQSIRPSASAPLTYREPGGLFEISFPQGYSYEQTGSGIAFVSADQRFGGSVDFGAAQGAVLDLDQLERLLKREYEQRLTQLVWQGSSAQPDGSLRVDWTGCDPQGNQLDAVSFVEQRGDTIFILNLFGINAPYNDRDAEFIVQSYRVQF